MNRQRCFSDDFSYFTLDTIHDSDAEREVKRCIFILGSSFSVHALLLLRRHSTNLVAQEGETVAASVAGGKVYLDQICKGCFLQSISHWMV